MKNLFFILVLLLPYNAFAVCYDYQCTDFVDIAVGDNTTTPCGTNKKISAIAVGDMGCRLTDPNVAPTWAANCTSYSGPSYPSGGYPESCTTEGYTRYKKDTYYFTYNDDPCEPSTLLCSDPDEPATCSDGSQSGDEEGIDCGGSCSAPCIKTCPDGQAAIASADGEMCMDVSVPDDAGNCAAGWTGLEMADGSTGCFKYDPDDCNIFVGDDCWVAPVYAADGAAPDGWLPEDSGPSADPWVKPEQQIEIYEDKGTTVDNGDGTSTITDSKTTSNTTTKADGTTITTNETETKTTIVDNTTGEVISTGTTITKEGDPQDDLTNYDLTGLKLPIESEYDGFQESDIPAKKGIISTITGFLSNMPLITALDDVTLEVTSTNADCTASLGTYFGKELKADFCRWHDYLSPLGALLVITMHVVAVFIVIGYKKKGSD